MGRRASLRALKNRSDGVKGNEFTRPLKTIIRSRQIIEAQVHEDLGEDYDWDELRFRWWPQREEMSNHSANGTETAFDPYKDFDRERRPNED